MGHPIFSSSVQSASVNTRSFRLCIETDCRELRPS
jgi:hypothetical protein